ncbi:hypothetical protein CFK38_09415 [Brachybacterium vulturis]|uniref:MNN4 protein n=1 Tax=Brachybacterium vulturis TaxID=2017484 RepID=A0A291GNB2_9MICO|nr:hypothetical protein [Brachybacterium vulturis]ATG51715.1 hypothetical protein CFK38_09415 [Brachybacterium vulturis]
MSTPPAPEPRTGTPPGPGARGGALAQDVSGSPKDFGLDVKRLRWTRIIVLAILSPLILLLALLAVRFVSMPLTQAAHLGAYEDGDYPAAVERLAPVEFANWFEPYLPHLSKGTSLLQQGEDAAAEEELRIALQEWTAHSDLNSPMHAQCKILNNLALSIERQADLIEDPQQRADRLFEAEQLLAPCAGGGGGGQGESQGGGGSGNEDSETTEGNGERVEEKRREADEEAGNDPDARGDEQTGTPGQNDPGDPTREDPEGGEPEEEAPTDGDSEQEQKDDELEQRNRDAQGGDGDDDPGETSEDPVKPW